MKNWLKIFVAIVILTVCVVCFSSGRAEAAYTTDGTYYPDLWTEVDWGSYVDKKQNAFSNHKYLIVCKQDYDLASGSPLPVNNFRYYLFSDDTVKSECYSLVDNYGYNAHIKSNGYIIVVSDGIVTELYESSNCTLYREGQIYPLGSNFDYRFSGVYSVPYSNLFYEPIITPTSTVSLSVDGKDVTITEPYEYYFVSYAYDKVRLIFSDEPLTADYISLDKVELYSGEQTTVCYTWDEDNPDFLASRMVFDYAWTITHSLSSDYASNYDVLNSRTGYTVFNTKLLHPVVDDLFSTLPDELLLGYDYYIVLRQDSPFAYTHDVVFYGWNDVDFPPEVSANLPPSPVWSGSYP